LIIGPGDTQSPDVEVETTSTEIELIDVEENEPSTSNEIIDSNFFALNDIQPPETEQASTSHANNNQMEFEQVENPTIELTPSTSDFHTLNDIQIPEEPEASTSKQDNDQQQINQSIESQHSMTENDVASMLQIDNATASTLSKSGDILSPTLQTSFDSTKVGDISPRVGTLELPKIQEPASFSLFYKLAFMKFAW
jgi:hypothetical protein